MPSIPPNAGAKVLVTGANGYIALHVIQNLLAAGYAVRGTVRSQAKVAHLTHTFTAYGDKFECIIVEDITKDGAFDEAVKRMDAVEHTASPVHLNFDDPQEAIVPAVRGTTSVLKSVLNFGTSVKRVVITSSGAAVVHVAPEPKVFSEKDWNEQAPAEVAEHGHAADAIHKYRASKTFAERAAWDLWNANKEKVGWDLVTRNPPYVFGPSLHAVLEPSALNSSMLDWWNSVVKGTKDDNTLANAGSSWVDVRDLGLAHMLALSKPDAGGERLIVSAGPFKWQDWLDAANALSPSPYPELPLTRGTPGAGSGAPGVKHFLVFDVSKAARVLGLGGERRYISLEDFRARGWK